MFVVSTADDRCLIERDVFSLIMNVISLEMTSVARWFIFKPKIPILVNIGGSCNGRYRYILWSFGRFCHNLVYFVAIWFILWSFGIFFPVLVCWTKKNLVTRCCRATRQTEDVDANEKLPRRVQLFEKLTRGSMLLSQFSLTFANFRRQNWRFSLKPILWSTFYKSYIAVVWVKNAIFLTKFYKSYIAVVWVKNAIFWQNFRRKYF
jgi:hypothetical protein